MENLSSTFLWALAILMLGCVLLSPVACTMHQQRIVQQAIASGTDPIIARCALESAESARNNPLCVVRAMQPTQPSHHASAPQ